MVNFMRAEKALVHGLVKLAGLRPQMVEIEPGTTMNFWAPSETSKKVKAKTEPLEEKKKAKKPAVVLLHGFAADGIVTWQLQVTALLGKYSVYVPDLLFFGSSKTSKTDRSPEFQAECVVKGLTKLGVETCTVVGFSYGGMVAFKMAELHQNRVKSVVVTGAVFAYTESINATIIDRLGFLSLSDMLLPTTVKGTRNLLNLAVYKKFHLPDRFYKDYFQAMFNNRKEKAELLENLVSKDSISPNFSQKLYLLWGEDDRFFDMEIAKSQKEKLGDKVTLQSIKKGGHLVNLERPCIYNRHLKAILASLHTDAA